MKKHILIFTALLIFAVQIYAQTISKNFRGYVNGIPVQMSLIRDGEKLSGTYFYTRIGKDLKLNGTIDSEGNFKLTETDSAGKITGEFSGKWEELADSNGATISGEWRKPNSEDSLGFIASEQMIEFTNGAKFTAKNFSEINKPKKFEITIEYPEIAGVNPAFAAKFNQLSKSRSMALYAAFKKDMMAQTAADLRNFPKGMTNTLDVNYSIEWATDEIISISFINSTYTGGAHGNYLTETLNFDLKNGKELKLADLFQTGVNYLKTISDYSIADLKTKLDEMSDDDWIKNGAGPSAENYSSWNLTKKGLMITFDPYQVAAYAAGMQNVMIPYSKLENVWRKDKMFAAK